MSSKERALQAEEGINPIGERLASIKAALIEAAGDGSEDQKETTGRSLEVIDALTPLVSDAQTRRLKGQYYVSVGTDRADGVDGLIVILQTDDTVRISLPVGGYEYDDYTVGQEGVTTGIPGPNVWMSTPLGPEDVIVLVEDLQSFGA